jgi:DNA invertase Pin-like site-specific DNA recombinase
MSLNNYGIKPNRIYVYMRVSTKSQAYGADGLKNQYKICDEFIKNNFKGTQVDWYEEVGSSYNNKSKLPVLNKIMTKFEPKSLLIVRDISRLGRDTFQVFTLLKKIKKLNSNIIGINENLCYNFSRLMDKDFSHKIIDSEKDSDKKNLLLTKRIELIKSQGGYLGRPPYGTIKIKFNSIPKLYKNPKESNIIDLMKKLYKEEKCIDKVTNYLNSNKIYNRNDVLWTQYTIKNILKKHFPNILLNPNSNQVNKDYLKIPDIPKEFNNLLQTDANIIIKDIVNLKL